MHHYRIVFIVRDEDPRNLELADDALLDEATNIFLCNGCQWFYFYRFGEVVDPYNKELELSYCLWKGCHDV